MTHSPIIRTSFTLAYDNCPYQAYLKYILGIRTECEAANLYFGTSIHTATTGLVIAESEGITDYDPVRVFSESWQKSLDTHVMDFSSNWSPEDLTATGEQLVSSFVDIWKESGYSPLIGPDGKAVVEKRLMIDFGEFKLTGQPDIVALDGELRLTPVDIKTTVSAYDEIFLVASEQLTDYQILVEGNSDLLGLEGQAVERLSFIEGLKVKVPKTSKGKGPRFIPPASADARSLDVMNQRLVKISVIADNVRKGWFPKTPRMAYNTPCTMCDFAQYCLEGDDTGLVFPSNSSEKEIAPLKLAS